MSNKESRKTLAQTLSKRWVKIRTHQFAKGDYLVILEPEYYSLHHTKLNKHIKNWDYGGQMLQKIEKEVGKGGKIGEVQFLV